MSRTLNDLEGKGVWHLQTTDPGSPFVEESEQSSPLFFSGKNAMDADAIRLSLHLNAISPPQSTSRSQCDTAVQY